MCPQMKTIQQLADESGIAYGAIRRWCLEGKIVFVKAGTKYLINVEKFYNFLNGEIEVDNAAGEENCERKI